MIGLLWFVLAILVSPFRSKARLESEIAVLRQQLIVLQRTSRGRVRLTDGDRWFFVQLLSLVPVDIAGSSDHQAGDAGALASGWFSQLLAMEISE